MRHKTQDTRHKLQITFFIKFILIVSLSWLISSNAFAERYRIVTTQQLIEKTKYLDHQMVVLKGEAIGDIMARGDNAWVNVQDEYNAVGIWASQEQLREIKHLGDYSHRGDIIKVKGRFMRADPDLGGEFCIRADSIQVLESGYPLPHEISENKIKTVKILFVVAVILIGLRIVIKRRTI